MEIGSKVLEMLREAEIVWDYADEYGEPGYKTEGNVLLGDYWCRKKDCSFPEENQYRNGEKKIHSVEYHYPRLMAALEQQGHELEWHDEWIVSYESSPSKAYRTTGNSYQWQSSILWTDGDFLTPDDDIVDWIAEVVNSPQMCLPNHVWSDADLMEQGFEEHECGFQNGWFEGMNDDPVKISDKLRKESEEEIDILFKLSYVSQFDLGFCVFTRSSDWEEKQNEAPE